MDWYSEIFMSSVLILAFLGMVVVICVYTPLKPAPQQTRLIPIKQPVHVKRKHRQRNDY